MSINANQVVIVSPSTPSLFRLESSEGPCKKVLEHLLYNATSHVPKLKEKSCLANPVSYWRLARLWREEVRAAQSKMNQVNIREILEIRL